ncbi:MAG TPA: hypothetical protein VN675_06040 [Burkholderiales bacterium]|nr:hypothetical protein [Burkholderiales bacterium]
MKVFAVLLATLLSNLAAAACPKPQLTDPARVRLTGDAVLIVTHATSAHDARFATKRGVDEAIHFAKSRRIPVVFLKDDSGDEYYFMEDCRPDYWVLSAAGEIPFDSLPSHVYVAGGHLEFCLSATLDDVIRIWSRQPRRNLTVTYLMDAIYSNGNSIEESDPFHARFRRFMGVVTYGRPGGEHWPKLTLLETMGVIRNEEHELQYLTKILPHYARVLPSEYRVDLKFNASVVKVLRPARGWNPPTLRFNFVESAMNLQGFAETAD